MEGAVKIYMKVTHKCENCGIEHTGRTALRWIGAGKKSKYGDKYNRRGYAFWCPNPICRRIGERESLRRFYPDATDAQLDAMIDEAEVKKIREN